MKNTEPKNSVTASPITIIINCLNGEDFLEEAIDSVLKQTFKNWELVLFDDRSTDRSAEIFNSYNDPRFHYILAERRMDLTPAREEAIKLTSGEWIAFLDQDDVWLPNKLEQQLKLLESPGADKVGLIYGRAKRFGYIDSGKDFDHHFEGKALPEYDIFDTLSKVANFIPMSSTMIRRSAFEEIKPAPKNVRLCPDYYFWMSISHQWHVRAVQDTCCLYRVRGNDFTAANGIQVFTEFLNIIEYFSDEFDHRTLQKKRRACQNLIGVAEITTGSLGKGITRIIQHGSMLHLIQRAPFYIFRTMKYSLSPRK